MYNKELNKLSLSIIRIMSLRLLKLKADQKRNISSGGTFSTMGVRRYHYYTGQNRYNKNRNPSCSVPESVGTTSLKPPKTTSGLLSERIHFPSKSCKDGSCPSYNWVKSFNPEEHAQSNYIHKVKVNSACKEHHRKDAGKVDCNTNCKQTYLIGGKKKYRSSFQKNVSTSAMDSSTYTNIYAYKKKCLPTPPCKAPFPFVVNQKGCNIWFKTPEEAMNAGFLPMDWMKCTTDDAFSSYTNSEGITVSEGITESVYALL